MKKYKLYSLKASALLAGSATIIALSGCANKEYHDIGGKIMHAEDISKNDFNEVYIGFSDITDDNLTKIPSDIKKLDIQDCYYLTSLDSLPQICPDIEELTVGLCPSITDFSFIYQLPNLKKVTFYECAGIDYELYTYLTNHGIENNITEVDLKANIMIDNIIKETINDQMTDEEKIKAITLYMVDNFEYDDQYTTDSNIYPLTSMLQNKKGVCAGYAYLANVLLRKANVNANYVVDYDHAWNIIKQDDKYYYLDTTNVDDLIVRSTVKAFDISPYYMSNPSDTMFTSMTPYNAPDNTVIIPKSFVEDIKRGENKKTLVEKYGHNAVAYWFVILGIPNILALSFLATQMKRYFQEVGKHKNSNSQEKTRSH